MLYLSFHIFICIFCYPFFLFFYWVCRFFLPLIFEVVGREVCVRCYRGTACSGRLGLSDWDWTGVGGM